MSVSDLSNSKTSGAEPSGYVAQLAGGGRRPPRRLLLGMMVAVFFSGGVIGSGSTMMFIHRRIEANEKHRDPGGASRRIVSDLAEKLALSERQTAQVEQITKDHLASLDRLRREVFFNMIRDEFKQMEEQVSAVLNGDQRTQYHAWLEERRQRLCPPGARHGHHAHGGHRRGSSSGEKDQRGAGPKADAAHADNSAAGAPDHIAPVQPDAPAQ